MRSRLFERNLTDREQLLGPEHPNTLISRNNLAGAYQAAGRLPEAVPREMSPKRRFLARLLRPRGRPTR